MTLSPFAGKPAPAELLVDIPRLVTAYYTGQPDASVSTQRVAFGTSGHRGSSFDLSFKFIHKHIKELISIHLFKDISRISIIVFHSMTKIFRIEVLLLTFI